MNNSLKYLFISNLLSFLNEKSKAIQKVSILIPLFLKFLLIFNCINVTAQLATSVSNKVSEYRKISVDEYISKAKAGWIGQMAGVGWGAPTEF